MEPNTLEMLKKQLADVEVLHQSLISSPTIKNNGGSAISLLRGYWAQGNCASTVMHNAGIAIAQEVLRLEAEIRQIKRDIALHSNTTITEKV